MLKDDLLQTEFSRIEMDVSISPACWLITCPIIHMGFCPYETTIELEAEEVVKTDVLICGKNVSRRPYGELGSVDKSSICCFQALHSNFGPIMPGCGCDGEKVDFAVAELKKRMKARGDTGQIKRTEELLKKFNALDAKLDLIMDHLKIEKPGALAMEGRPLTPIL
uniref:Uncharacterized protein n=1 Tax=Leptocylindrus danicus TaxID=163516 RepID=A0A7S2LLC8_9STRA|mmetsp:Transcript_7177/g.10723  ORF Transcript_7177/g.10723 Transcript_7177/m.10723 type:complete len:166 (+) Transcript_7177:150-647(+)|eukprot:CAMPEP_0116033648 /NCGR_PEP_ID=MMETSP0321-20121206/19127_1 /TAXON_ID=163516 /ORGANISM="Leptocylindrus danicus var. danicus, Strain B650" /LENGTH=165 /DNA_ID=CAMNT_0003509789 /DNA_START=118 /DNA_END=615 /DNA_ORIENTATION=+